MSAERDVTRIVRLWLDDGVTVLPDRVLDAVLHQVPATPQRRAGWLARRFPIMNDTTLRWGVAAAAGILVAIAGIWLLPAADFGEDQSPSPTPSVGAFNDLPDGGVISPGTYFIGGMPVGVTLAVPTGWEVASPGGAVGAALRQPESDSSAEVLLAFWIVDRVYDDACSASPIRGVGPSVDELVDALTAMSSVEASTPTPASVDGFAGQHLTLQRAVECPADYYYLWETPATGIGRVDHGQGDPATDELWVLDVDGTRLVIGIHSYTSATPADLAEARVVVDSIQFE